jgi:hypothetical protein
MTTFQAVESENLDPFQAIIPQIKKIPSSHTSIPHPISIKIAHAQQNHLSNANAIAMLLPFTIVYFQLHILNSTKKSR